MTRDHLHLDRVATPWLIRRFVDPAADFVFVAWGDTVEEEGDTIPFGIPGAALSPHDGDGTTFAKVMRRYGLDTPALRRMERLVAAGVAHALGREMPAGLTADDVALAGVLDRLGAGFGIAYPDEQHLAHGLALYEAVYTLCCVAELDPALSAEIPTALRDRVTYLRELLPVAVAHPPTTAMPDATH